MIKYVFWDFNGTILDDRKICHDFLNELLLSEGKKPITFKRYLDVFGFPVKDYYIKAGISFKDRSFEEMSQWFIEFYQPLSLQQSLYEGVIETLKALKEKNILNICLSASKADNLIEQLNHFNIFKYFKAILGTSDVLAVGKKDVAIKYILKNNLKKEECLLIGDTVYDYELAKDLGFKVVLFTKGHQSRKRLINTNEVTIDKISDLLKIIEGIER